MKTEPVQEVEEPGEAGHRRSRRVTILVLLLSGIVGGLWVIGPYLFAGRDDPTAIDSGPVRRAVLAGLGTGYAAPRMRKALKAGEAGDAAEVRRLLDPLDKVVGPILGVLTAVIVYLMLVQPGF